MKKASVKHICFDLDGTLIDSKVTILKSTIATLKALNIGASLPEDKFFTMIGMHFIDIFNEFNIDVPDFNKFISVYKSIYFNFIDDSIPFPGVAEVLKHFNEKEIKFSRDYLYILGLSDNFDTWHCDQLAGLFLQLKYDMKNIVLYGNYHEILSNKDLKSYGTEKKDRILNFLNYIDITLGIWVLQCLTSTFENRLTKLRDSYGTIDINKLSTEPSLLVELDTKVLENQKNISPFLHELKSFCEHQGSFMHDIYEFKATHKMYKNDDGLFNTIRKNLMFLGDYLSRNEKLLQNTANANRQIATVISSNDVAKTNIGLQKQMNLMTLVILFFTIIASVSAIIEIQKKFDLYAIFRNVIIYIKSII